MLNICLYGGCGSALSAWISKQAQLPIRQDREAFGAFPPSDSSGLHPVVPDCCVRLSAAHQTCQTSSHYRQYRGPPVCDEARHRRRKTGSHRSPHCSKTQCPHRTSTQKYSTNQRCILHFRASKPSLKTCSVTQETATAGQTLLERLHTERSPAAELRDAVQMLPSHDVRPQAPPPPEGQVGDLQVQLQQH